MHKDITSDKELCKKGIKQKITNKALKNKKKYLDKNSDNNDIINYSYNQFLEDNNLKDNELSKDIFNNDIDKNSCEHIYNHKTKNSINTSNYIMVNLEHDLNKYDNDNYIHRSNDINDSFNVNNNKESDNITKLISNLSERKKKINQISSLINLLSNNEIEEVVFKNKSSNSGRLFDNDVIEKIKNITLFELKDKLIDLNIEIKDLLKEAYSS